MNLKIIFQRMLITNKQTKKDLYIVSIVFFLKFMYLIYVLIINFIILIKY